MGTAKGTSLNQGSYRCQVFMFLCQSMEALEFFKGMGRKDPGKTT